MEAVVVLVTRERLEQIEADTLAHYAQISRHSRGRLHHDPEPKYRTAFQRDRDRVVHSAAFRRLEYKTQVFVNDEGDYYRTRLTHTLEVAQIGRSLARALAVNEDLVEVICLAHDLGHAPFGHAGEGVLDALTQSCGGFNHNHQSYRVVTQLERRYPGWAGLNLAHETLEGIAKHESEYDLSPVTGHDVALKGSVEAQIANLADELAYNAHDLDDGLQAGLIDLEALRQIELWRMVADKVGWHGHTLDEITRHHLIRELVGLEVDDVLQETAARLNALNPKTPMVVQQHTEQVVAHSIQIQLLNRQLKDFLYQNMYFHYRVARMATRAQRFIEQIFKVYMQDLRQLPPAYQDDAKVRDVERVIADYIASMTDREAVLEYRRLFDPQMRP
jgi:dGTPase